MHSCPVYMKTQVLVVKDANGTNQTYIRGFYHDHSQPVKNLRLPPDAITEANWANYSENMTHHRGISQAEAEQWLGNHSADHTGVTDADVANGWVQTEASENMSHHRGISPAEAEQWMANHSSDHTGVTDADVANGWVQTEAS